MTITLNRQYAQTTIEIGALSRAFREVALADGQDPDRVRVKADYHASDMTEERILTIGDLGSIRTIEDSPRSIWFQLSDGWMSLTFQFSYLLLLVSSDTGEKAEGIARRFADELGLARVTPSTDESELPPKIPDKPTLPQADDKRLKCFLAQRFTKHADSLALDITRFLNLLRVDVVSGKGFEPRKVSEKVAARLQDVDFGVCLVTKDGPSAWTRDEIGFMVGRGYHVIPIVEQGAEFPEGILGDAERLSFAQGHVGDAFIGLAEAVNFIRENGASKAQPAATSTK